MNKKYILHSKHVGVYGGGANNGLLKLTIDGQLKQTLSGKDNNTRQVDYLRLGAVAGIDSSDRLALRVRFGHGQVAVKPVGGSGLAAAMN